MCTNPGFVYQRFSSSLVACGQTTPSTPSAGTVESQGSEQTLTVRGDLNGKTFGNAAALRVADKALKGPAQISIARLSTNVVPTLPPVENVYSSFIIGDVQ